LRGCPDASRGSIAGVSAARQHERRPGALGREVAHHHHLRQLRDDGVLLAAQRAQLGALALAGLCDTQHPVLGELVARERAPDTSGAYTRGSRSRRTCPAVSDLPRQP
jgi:hypothetical protein